MRSETPRDPMWRSLPTAQPGLICLPYLVSGGCRPRRVSPGGTACGEDQRPVPPRPAWAMDDHAHAELVVDLLVMALSGATPDLDGPIQHDDRGGRTRSWTSAPPPTLPDSKSASRRQATVSMTWPWRRLVDPETDIARPNRSVTQLTRSRLPRWFTSGKSSRSSTTDASSVA